MMEELLTGLNKAQRAAVTSNSAVVQVLAPPGSGKTKTLTARVAYLISHGLKPWNIIVCTFTVKAAKEMQERLQALVGEEVKKKIRIGTFHGIALRYLRNYRQEAGLKDNFGVADSGDSLGVVKAIKKTHNLEIDPKQARNRISTLKSKGIDCTAFTADCKNKTEQQEFIHIFAEYEAYLDKCNLLDYDDILLRCVALLKAHPECVTNIDAVLVDEFQDTNGVQYELMAMFAQWKQHITIVGDPDQCIYGWRSAEIKNLSNMKERWPDTLTINLEENYRSAGAILRAAQAIIEQDKDRPQKKLQATHSFGMKPVLRKLPTSRDEATWIISELKRLHARTGQLLKYNDFAILLRTAALSRSIEQALGREGIPYRMVGGHRFFDRVEVKVIIDYLRIIDLATHSEAVERVVNLPARGVGDAALKALQNEAHTKKLTLWEVIAGVTRGKHSHLRISSQAQKGLSQFVDIILTGQRKMTENANLVDMIYFLIQKINFEAYLKSKYPEDNESRWANVEELVAQAADVTVTMQSKENIKQEATDQDHGEEGEVEQSILCRFLENVALAAATDEKSGEKEHDVVTISTMHAAKGLEWPVVFIPACYDGIIPHGRNENVDEERRLLYVGMTRAQAVLYLSCPLKDSQRQETSLSTFLAQSGIQYYFDEKGSNYNLVDAQGLARILRRGEPLSIGKVSQTALPGEVEDDYWPVNGEAPIGQSDESTRFDLDSKNTPVFGNSRSAMSLQDVDGDTGPLGFFSVKDRYVDLMDKQEKINQERLAKLAAQSKEKAPTKGRKRQIEGQGNISGFFTRKEQLTASSDVLQDITNVVEDIHQIPQVSDKAEGWREVRREPLYKKQKETHMETTVTTNQYMDFSSPTKPMTEDAEAMEQLSIPAPRFRPAAISHTTSMSAITRKVGLAKHQHGFKVPFKRT